MRLSTLLERQNGFTLLEMLIVLGAWSVLILLCVPLAFNLLEEQQEKQILKTLESDVLYLQNLSTISPPKRGLYITFHENSYAILDSLSADPILMREMPSDYVLDSRTATKIAFNRRGSIKKAGTIALKTKQSKYTITFPLGKARCYIAKQ